MLYLGRNEVLWNAYDDCWILRVSAGLRQFADSAWSKDSLPVPPCTVGGRPGRGTMNSLFGAWDSEIWRMSSRVLMTDVQQAILGVDVSLSWCPLSAGAGLHQWKNPSNRNRILPLLSVLKCFTASLCPCLLFQSPCYLLIYSFHYLKSETNKPQWARVSFPSSLASGSTFLSKLTLAHSFCICL
jgi:hypothetical protein